MEKQLNVTLDSKVENVKSKNKSPESVKTGKSLFDQLLANTNKSVSSKTVNKENTDLSKTRITFNKNVSTFDNKTTSLLDKLILDTNKKISKSENKPSENTKIKASLFEKVITDKNISNDSKKISKSDFTKLSLSLKESLPLKKDNIKNDTNNKETIKIIKENTSSINETNISKEKIINKDTKVILKDDIKSVKVKDITKNKSLISKESTSENITKIEDSSKNVKVLNPNIILDKNTSTVDTKDLGIINNKKLDKNIKTIDTSKNIDLSTNKLNDKNIDLIKSKINNKIIKNNPVKELKIEDEIIKSDKNILNKELSTNSLAKTANTSNTSLKEKSYFSSIINKKDNSVEKLVSVEDKSTNKKENSLISKKYKSTVDSLNKKDIIKENTSDKDNKKINTSINIEELNTIKSNNNEDIEFKNSDNKTLSLFDSIKKNIIGSKTTNEDVSKIVKNNIINKSSLSTKDLDNSFVDNKNRNKKIEISSVLEKSNIKKNDIKSIQKDNLFTNMYLSSQQSVATRHELENVASIKNNIITKQNMAEVKKAAKDLNLEHKESKVINRKESNKYLSKEVVLDKLAFARNILRTNIENILGAVDSTIVKNELSEMPDTILNVNPMNVNNIQSTIIGARQSLSSFMSDFAKKVYQNYKPPVTALRIILNPSSLGSISIIMKSDKDKGISISMNMSNSNTLDMMNDNQSILRNALEKNFESIGEFSLDFNMQDQNSSNKKQDQQENKKNSTSEILENMSNNTSSDNLESDQNYM